MMLPFDEWGARVIGSAGIDQVQRASGRRSRSIAAMADHQSQSLSGLGDRTTTIDTPPAQIFTAQPPEVDQLAVGAHAFLHLPGPVAPSAWDGESGSSMPEWARP